MSRQRAALGRRPFAAGMRFGRLRALGLLAGSSLLGVAGCGFDAYTTADAPQNACTLVEDCLAGTCVDGLCVEPAPEALRVFVEVEPLENADRTLPHRWRFTPEVVVGPGVQDLTLPPGVEVVGQVRVGGLSVPADIAFTRIQEVPVGMEEALRTRTYAEPTNVDVNGTSFAADFASVLGGGGVYDVTISPTTAPFACKAAMKSCLPCGVMPPRASVMDKAAATCPTASAESPERRVTRQPRTRNRRTSSPASIRN